MSFSREAIKARLATTVKKVNIEGWGDAYIRQWSGLDRVKYMEASSNIKIKNENNEDVLDFGKVTDNQFLMVAIGLCDESGNRLYADEEIKELASEIKADVIEKLFMEISSYNGLEFEELKSEIKN